MDALSFANDHTIKPALPVSDIAELRQTFAASWFFRMILLIPGRAGSGTGWSIEGRRR
jgi:hypothetical protein